MKSKFCVVIFFISFLGNLFSQSVKLDSTQVERIMATNQLWGHLKYFHPYLSEPTIDWERAFTDNIEGVIEANKGEDYAIAVQKMLARLNDPVTKVVGDEDPSVIEDTLKYPIIQFIQDSVLLVSIRDYSDLQDRNYTKSKFLGLKGKLRQSSGVIFDIRSPIDIRGLSGYLSYHFSEIENSLVSSKIYFPGFRARYHDGFVPEVGETSGGYFSGHYTQGEKWFSPDPAPLDVPIVFIVSENSEIPRIALALQMAGQATILSTGSLTDASLILTYNYKLDDSLYVDIRMHELPAGYDLKEDYLIPSETEEEDILEMALQLIKGNSIPWTIVHTDIEIPKNELDQETPRNKVGSYPDLPHRLLAAAKIWTVIHYFFAYQDLMERDWDEVLREYIPRMALAVDAVEYNLAVAEMYNNIQDGHGYIGSDVLSDYFGRSAPPIKIRFIQERPVVVALVPGPITNNAGIEVGDIVLEVDGENIKDRFDRYAQYTASSNSSGLKNSISKKLLNGSHGDEVSLKILKKDGSSKSIFLPRTIQYASSLRMMGNDRNKSPITRLINDSVGYADLDRLTTKMVEPMFSQFKDTKVIIFDMRGYPNGTAWFIAPHLTDKPDVYMANFRRYSPMGINFGESKHLTIFNQPIPPPKFPTYKGKTIMLIDERTISQAEHSGLSFEAANGTKFVGSQTAGANGDITNFRIPGNITLTFSGHDVRHADGRQLQKTGLVPDIPVKPTIEGTRAGKDEVLEKAIEYAHTLIKED